MSPPRRWGTTAWLGVALAGLALILLAGLFPEADPIAWLPGGLEQNRIDEFMVEAPAKAHEARNWALFGEWHRNPADNYQFWRSQAPAWVYPLAWTFRAFGVSYTTLRLFSIAIGLAGFVGFVLVLRRFVPAWAGVAAAWLYATNLFVVLVARSGLIEVLLNTLAAWLALALFQARRHPGWLVLSQAIFTLAFFGKQGIVFLFPLLVVANVLAFVRWWQDGAFPRLRWLPVLTAVLAAVVTAWLVSQPEYLRALDYNFTQVVTGAAGSRAIRWWYRFDATRISDSMLVLLPVIGVFGLPGLVWLSWTALRDRRLSWSEGVLLAWTASAWIAVVVARGWTVRQNSIVIAPSLIVAMLVLVRLAELPRARIGVLLAAVGAIALGTNVAHHVRRYDTMTWDMQPAIANIERVVGDRPAVIIGRFAMPILLSTPYDLYYVKGDFNTTSEQLDSLAPTHILLSDDEGTDEILEEVKPIYLEGQTLTEFELNHLRLRLLPLPKRQKAKRQEGRD